jgi:hypothetical protein
VHGVQLRVLFLIIALIFSSKMTATTLPKLNVEYLFTEADDVVIVEVVSGSMIGELNESCGAKYKARVINRFKGNESKYINFGHFHGYEIGSKYLLFLTSPDREFKPISSTNSNSMRAENEHLKKCHALLTKNKVMHSGYGAMKVELTSKLDYKQSVAIPSRYVSFPESLDNVPANVGENGEYSDYIWALETDVINYLNQQNAPNKPLKRD